MITKEQLNRWREECNSLLSENENEEGQFHIEDSVTEDELDSLSDTFYNMYAKIRDEKRDRELEPYNMEGKYMRYTGLYTDFPIYMYVRSNFITTKPGYDSKEKYILYQGHGFNYEFGEYSDCQSMTWSGWYDEYVPIDRFLEYEHLRQEEPDNVNNNSYKIEEITKEEFENKFREAYSKLMETFALRIEEDEDC